MYIQNKKQTTINKHFIAYTIILSLVLLSLNVQANGYSRYQFPPLEEVNSTNKNEYTPSQTNGVDSYYQQPQARYTFPALEKQQQSSPYSRSRYYYPAVESKQKYKRQDNYDTKTYQNTSQRNAYSGNSYGYGGNKGYQNTNGIFNSIGQNNGFNPWNAYSSPYNNLPYPMTNSFNSNPFSNNSFFPSNNSWNPFSNSLSNGPNFNNGMMSSPMQSYPNIRTPGFFSR